MTSFFDTTTNLWLDAFLAGRGVILTMMMTATMTTKTTTTTTVNEDNDKDTNGEDNDNLIIRHNNQPVVGCIPGREGGDFDDDDNGNNSHKGDDNDERIHQRQEQ